MTLTSVDDVVDALGGTVKVAALAEVGKSAISTWRARGAIPAEYFLRVSAALRDLGKRASPGVFKLKSPMRKRAQSGPRRLKRNTCPM